MILRQESEMPRIEDVAVLESYRLRLWFDNGKVGDVDLSHLVGAGPVFMPFVDPDFFALVHVESGTVCWPNEVDLDPDHLYESAIAVDPAPPRPHPDAKPPDPSAPDEADSLPEICRFLGLVIKMYWSEHSRPHFHVEYAEFKARIGIEPLSLMEGKLPPRVLAIAIEWAALHQVELQENWDRARRHQSLKKIAPLE